MIGILGGTFDPIHNGHLRVALDAAEALGLEQVRFVPLHVAVHREQPVASAEHRLAMARAAVAGVPEFTVDDRELRREGPSYSVDTLHDLRQELGSSVPMCLLVGDDAFNGFAAWKEPGHILELAHLAVLQRPGHGISDAPDVQALLVRYATKDPRDVRRAPGGSIVCLPVTQLEISASDVRERLAQGRSARYLVPDTVSTYVEQHGLYAGPDQAYEL